MFLNLSVLTAVLLVSMQGIVTWNTHNFPPRQSDSHHDISTPTVLFELETPAPTKWLRPCWGQVSFKAKTKKGGCSNGRMQRNLQHDSSARWSHTRSMSIKHNEDAHSQRQAHHTPSTNEICCLHSIVGLYNMVPWIGQARRVLLAAPHATTTGTLVVANATKLLPLHEVWIV